VPLEFPFEDCENIARAEVNGVARTAREQQLEIVEHVTDEGSGGGGYHKRQVGLA
jgi:hypothetical protein